MLAIRATRRRLEPVLLHLVGGPAKRCAQHRSALVNALNVDDTRDPARPTHTRLLARDILIVENLTGLAALHGRRFRFFAVPIKARRTASMPVRAFAELE